MIRSFNLGLTFVVFQLNFREIPRFKPEKCYRVVIGDAYIIRSVQAGCLSFLDVSKVDSPISYL